MRICSGTTLSGYECTQSYRLDSNGRCRHHPVYRNTYYDRIPPRPRTNEVSASEWWEFWSNLGKKETSKPTPQRILVDVSDELIPEEQLPPQIDCASVGKLLDDTREKIHMANVQMQRINEDIASLRTAIQLYACMTTLGVGGDLSREIKRSKDELTTGFDDVRVLSADIARFQQQLRSFTASR